MDRTELNRIARRAMVERDLRPAFSPAAHEQAEALVHASVDGSGKGDVHDLRHLPWCSIDNDDSLDLDQLTASKEDAGGEFTVWVAVADVDALVPPGTPIDDHAAANTTSVYTAAGVFPMLPERLSTDLSSLNEDAERLALVVALRLRADGEVLQSQLLRGVVRSRAKLAYDSVAAWLDGRQSAPPGLARSSELQRQVRMQDRLAQGLKQRRHARGALDLQTTEARPVFVGGELVDLRTDDRNRAKELIGELMIAANTGVARFLDERHFPSLRRFLKEPDRWDRIVQLAQTHGATLPPQPDVRALDTFLQARRRADPGEFADLSLAVVKLLGSGEYSVSSPTSPSTPGGGHFGLAVHDYAHATAPNRRFPDLVTHRLVKAALASKAPPYETPALVEIAAHCTRQERNAGKVERHVRKAAAALLLAPRIGDRFHAVVTGVSSKGTFVRTSRPVVEGRLVEGDAGLDVGDALSVRLVAVDAAQSHIDFVRT